MLSCMSLSSRSSSRVAWSCSLVCSMAQFSLARESECLVPFVDGTPCNDFGILEVKALTIDPCFYTFETAQYILVVLWPDAITVELFLSAALSFGISGSSVLLSVFLMS